MKIKNWEQLWKEHRNEQCTDCGLHEGAQAVCLMGQGPVPCEVLMVGEAPGYREDTISKPFSGKAGQLLEQLLTDAGLNRERIFITNTNKCRPPENRTPTLPEIKACALYLDAEITAVCPKIIVPLGAVALRGITGRKSGITTRAGQEEWSEKYDCWVLPMVHPAYVLRTPQAGSGLSSHLRKLKEFLDNDCGFRTEEHDYRIIGTSDELHETVDELLKHRTVAYDCETTGLDPYYQQRGEKRTARVVTIGFSHTPGSGYCVPIHHPGRNRDSLPLKKVKAELRRLFQGSRKNSIVLVGHNAKFDDKWIERELGVFPEVAFDTMIAAHVLDENQPKGLKQLAGIYCGAPNWDEGIDFGKTSAQSIPLDELGIYNCYDADYTLRLREVLLAQLKEDKQKLRIFKHLLMPASRLFNEVERRGIWIDNQKLVAARRTCRKKLDKVWKELDEYTEGYDGYFPKGGTNWNSPKFVGGILFDHIGLPILIRTAKGAPSTAEGALVRLRADTKHPITTSMLTHRKWTKYWTTYIKPYFFHKRAGDRIHSTYKLTGTRTGRLSSANPNIQQTPRDGFIRGIFGAPPGWKFVDVDYSQIELRLVAAMAHERNMLRAFDAGVDIHLATARSLLSKSDSDITFEERKLAKAVNFGLIYGMGYKKLQLYSIENYEVDMSDKEAKRYYAAFHKAYPGIKKYHRRQIRTVQQLQRVNTLMGRARHLPDVLSQQEGVAAAAEREAINSPIQGLASDLMLLSMIRIRKELDPETVKLVGSLHDSILMEVKEEAVDEVLPIVKQIMENPDLSKFRVKALKVPIVVDAKVGTHWRNDNPEYSFDN